jgi:predicted O-methyltransferase YrrM
MPEYRFTSDWFTTNIPTWEQILGRTPTSRVLEVGSYEGRSTCYLIERCGSLRPVEIYCIDSWEGGVGYDPTEAASEVEARFDHNVKLALDKAAFSVELKKLKKRSQLALAELYAAQKADYFDLVYIDGSHEAPDVLADAVMAFPLLKIGGVMIFDDYAWSPESLTGRDPLLMPKPGIDAFMNLYSRKMALLAGGPLYQLYTQKTAD